MGCGVSKLDVEEAGGGQGGEFKILRRRSNQGAVADSTILNKRLLEMSEHNKDSKITNSNDQEKKKTTQEHEEEEEDDRESNDQEDEKDEDDIPESSILYPGSPSFRDYCAVPYLSADSIEDSLRSGPVRELPRNKCESDNNKKMRKQEAKRRRIGRGLKNVKNLLSYTAASNDASQKPQVRSWD